MTIGQSRSGRWWLACTHPACGHYESGKTSKATAERRAQEHQSKHTKEHR